MSHRILITDDNSEYRQSVMEMLQLEGFELIEASNGQEAVHLAKTQRPDLILCDIDMPVMDGFTALAALKADTTTAAIPFFLVTGRADAESIQRGDALGADDYLIKPINTDVLLLKIRHYLTDK